MSHSARMLAIIGSLVALTLATSATADSWIRDHPVSAGGTLRIDLDFGSVRVDSHVSRIAHIEAEVRGLGANAYVLALSDDGDQLTLTGRAAPWLDFLTTNPGVEIRVLVPPDFSLEFVTRDGTVDVSSVSGAVVRSRWGSVRVQDVRRSLNAESRAGGGIDIDAFAVVAGSWNAPIRARFTQAPSALVHARADGIRSCCGERIHPVNAPINVEGLRLELGAARGKIVPGTPEPF